MEELEEGSLIVSFFLSLINMSHSMYSVKNSHHPNNTAPDRITSVAPLLLGAVKDVTSTFYQFRILAVWPLIISVTQISGKVRPFTMEWSLGSFRTLWRQTRNHIICSERGIIFDTVRLEPIKLFGGAHWLEVSIFSLDVKFQKCAQVASIAYLSKDPRMVRAFGPL